MCGRTSLSREPVERGAQIRASLFLLTLLILVITTLCVSSSFSELVIERSKEIGILKALGERSGRCRILCFRIGVIALTATLAGYAVAFSRRASSRSLRRGFRLQPSWAVLGA